MEFNQHEINIMRNWYTALRLIEENSGTPILDQQDHDLVARLPKPAHHGLVADGLTTKPPGLPKL